MLTYLQGFSIISNKLKEMYQMITLGGDAELELVDSLDPFSEGIVFRWDTVTITPFNLFITNFTFIYLFFNSRTSIVLFIFK